MRGPPEQGAIRPHPCSSVALFLPGRRCTSRVRSEEHTSELQSLAYLVCRLLLEKKNIARNASESSGSTDNTFSATSFSSEARRMECQLTQYIKSVTLDLHGCCHLNTIIPAIYVL